METKIPRPLVEAIARGNAVLFCGAGLSMGAGLPGWSELLSPLAKDIGLTEDERDNLLQVAQDYELERGRHANARTRPPHRTVWRTGRLLWSSRDLCRPAVRIRAGSPKLRGLPEIHGIHVLKTDPARIVAFHEQPRPVGALELYPCLWGVFTSRT